MPSWVLLFVLAWVWIFGSFVTANAASKRGMNGVDWLFLAMFASPFIAMLALLARPPRT